MPAKILWEQVQGGALDLVQAIEENALDLLVHDEARRPSGARWYFSSIVGVK